MKYTFTYEKRGIGLESKIMNGETLDQCLKIFLQECMDTDDTGIFFELENVDVQDLENNERFHRVILDGNGFGIMLEKIEENDG